MAVVSTSHLLQEGLIAAMLFLIMGGGFPFCPVLICSTLKVFQHLGILWVSFASLEVLLSGLEVDLLHFSSL